MHSHNCRYCENDFVCGGDAATCFKRFVVCDGCFWTHDFRYFLLVAVLGIVAIGMTLYLLFGN